MVRDEATWLQSAGRDYIPIMEPLASVADSLRKLGHGTITQVQPLGGGCINDTMRIRCGNSTRVVLKQQPAAAPDFFAAEAVGLRALSDTGSLRVPEVLLVTREFLLLEDLGDGKPRVDFWQSLGRGLAALHREPRAEFGFGADNYCGRTPQVNSPTRDGFEFFGQHRLLSLARQARDRSLLNKADLDAVEYLAGHLSRWIPPQVPVLLHGDLWSGNVHCDRQGEPALIDPACYWGWAEAELAMTTLFGAFDPRFYASYLEQSGMDTRWRERAPLYNLYHLLNHLLLFGGSYAAQVRGVLRHFGP